MRRTPWKLAAGAMALSLGGLAVVADVPSRMVSCAGVPVVQAPEPVVPAPLPPPSTPEPVIPVPTLPAPSGNVITPADLPAVPLVPAASPPLVLVTAMEPAPMPRPAPQVFELPIPVVPASKPMNLPPVEPSRPPTQFADPVVTPPVPEAPPATPIENSNSPPPVRSNPIPPIEFVPATVEKKLKVILQMGDERPHFEVRDGDVVYLKVICDRVEVKSPSDQGETMSVLRASNQVSFITPGGEGMCDELCVVPGTGQVIVNGKVAFKYSWGKVETTVSGERMTFRLGSAPGMTPATIPASFQRRP